MSDKNRQRIEVALLALLFGAGAGWGAFQMRLGVMENRLTRIEDRVTAIYCSQVPEPIRGACQ